MFVVDYLNSSITTIIEKAGRSCYKSEKHIKEGSDVKFINSIVKSGHESVIEHSNIILSIHFESICNLAKQMNIDGRLEGINEFEKALSVLGDIVSDAKENAPYVRYVDATQSENLLFAGNVKAFKDWYRYSKLEVVKESLMNNLLSRLPYCLVSDIVTEPNEEYIQYALDTANVSSIKPQFIGNSRTTTIGLAFNDVELINVDADKAMVDRFCKYYGITEKQAYRLFTITVKQKMPRIITQQEVRARDASSYSQESQRYVDYCKNHIEFIKPDSIDGTKEYFVEFPNDLKSDYMGEGLTLTYKQMMKVIESMYYALRNDGVKPEDARSVLPNSTKSEIFITRSMESYEHYFHMRVDSHAQDYIRETAFAILSFMKEQGFYSHIKLDVANKQILNRKIKD